MEILLKTMKRDKNYVSQEILRIMKISFLIMVVSILQVSASVYSQKTKLNLNMENSTIKEVLEEVERQSEFTFFYNDAKLDVTKKVSLDIKDKRIEDVLDRVLNKGEVIYEIVDKHIILRKAKAQSNKTTITGVVKDSKGSTLPGVSVMEKETGNGVVTDVNGNYSISVSEGTKTLVFSFIGMKKQEVVISSRNKIDIVMQEDLSELEEVVVVGYGTQKKINLTGAVESVSSKTIENKGAASVTEALQGRISNLNINYGNGGIDASPSINVRGYTSLNDQGGNGSPLILIDGIPSNASILKQMNPNDIQSVSVLKDASASAIYGGRAAFGVILVTTKRGTNKKLNVTVNYNYKISTPTEFPKFVDTYTHAITVNEALKNRGSSPRFKDDYVQKLLDYKNDPINSPIDEIVNPVYDENGKLIKGDYYYYGTVDYMNEVFKKRYIQQKMDFSVSGGTKKSSIYASFGYTKDEGMYRVGNEDLKIYNMRLNSSTKVTDWWTVDARVAYIKHKYDKPFNYRDFYTATYFQRTYFPLRNRGNGKYMNHPIAYLDSGARYKFEDDDIRLTAGTEFKIVKGLVLKGTFSYHSNTGLNKDNRYKLTLSDNYGYRYPVDKLWAGWSNGNSHIYHRTKQSKSYVTDIYAQYDKTFGNKHKTTLLAGFNQEDYEYLFYYAKKEKLITESVPSMNLTLGEDHVKQNAHHWAIRGAFYRFNYHYDNKYLLELSGRYDGSSRFKKSDRFGFFPSGSLAWRVSHEPFMKFSRKWIDDLKFRVSYGSLGNQNVDTYAYIAEMGSYKPNYIMGSEKPVAIAQPELIDPKLTWEEVRTINFGVNLTALKNRLGVSLDVYKRETKDMLVAGDPLPGILGTSAPTQNSADLETKGWGVTVNWNDKIGDFSYGARVNVYDSKAFITKFKNPTGALSKYREGEELGEIWGYETEGFFKDEADAATAINGGSHDQSFISGRKWKPGDIKYKDLNGDGKIDQGKKTIDDHGDLKVIGNSRARYNYGITLNASWKGISLETFFQGVGQRHFMPSGSIFFPYVSAWDNLQTHQLNQSWTPENKDAYFPQMEAYAYRNYKTQSKYLQNAAYIRLKHLSLSYELPKNLINKAYFNSVVFSFNAHNLWESHDLRAPFDPEGGNGLQVPFRRSFSFGLKITI